MACPLFFRRLATSQVLEEPRDIPDRRNMQGRDIAAIVLRAFDTSPATLAPLMPQVPARLPTVQSGRVYLMSAEVGGT